jgi:hypothetical protein
MTSHDRTMGGWRDGDDRDHGDSHGQHGLGWQLLS